MNDIYRPSHCKGAVDERTFESARYMYCVWSESPLFKWSNDGELSVPVVTNTAKGQTTPLQRNALRKFRINIEEVAAFKHFEVSQVWDLGQRGVITVDYR